LRILSRVRRKATPKKHTEVDSRKASENDGHADGSDAEGKGDCVLLDARSHSGSEVQDDVRSGTSYRQHLTRLNEI